MSDIDSFDPFDPRNPAYLTPIRRQQFNTFRFPGFGQDPEISAPAPTPTPAPTTPGGADTPAGLRGAFGVRSQEDTQPFDNPSFRGNQPGGGGVSLDEMSDAQLLNYVATIGDDPIIGPLTSGTFLGRAFGYLDEINQVATYNRRFGTGFRTLDEVRADAAARLTSQPLSPLALGPVVQQAPSATAAAGAGQPVGRGVVPDTGLAVPTPGVRPPAPTRAVPGIRGGSGESGRTPTDGRPFTPPIPGQRPEVRPPPFPTPERSPRDREISPLEGIGAPGVVGQAPFEPPVPDTRPDPPEEPPSVTPPSVPQVPTPGRKPEPPARETAAASKPDTNRNLTASRDTTTSQKSAGGGFGGKSAGSSSKSDRDNDRESRGSGGGSKGGGGGSKGGGGGSKGGGGGKKK